MPIKSRAQRRKFAELLMKGKISDEVYERWNREAGSNVLPERVKPKGSKTKRPTTNATQRKAASMRKKRQVGRSG